MTDQNERFCQVELSVGGRKHTGLGLDLDNSRVYVLSEGEPKLGTLVMGTPIVGGFKPTESTTLMGTKWASWARSLSETLSHKTGKPAMISLHFREEPPMEILLGLAEKIQEEFRETQEEVDATEE